jgi:carboxylesterase
MKTKQKIKAFRGSLVFPGGRTGVLLFHSLGGNPIELRFVAQALAREGYTVYCPLVPGMGGGTDVTGLSTRENWLDAVKQAHDELSSHCDTVLVGGVSAGCMLALRLTEERPDQVHGLMMFAPTFWPNGWAIPKTMHLFKLIRHKVVSSLIRLRQRPPYGIKDERLRNFVLESFKSDERPIEDLLGRGGKLVWEFRRLAREARRKLGTLKHRMIVFHPREDDQSDISNAMIIQREAGGLVEMLVLDDCYHMVTLDRQRGIVADRAVEFARRLVGEIAEKRAVERKREIKELKEKGAAE